MDNETTIFMHIPKTGGTTLYLLFLKQYQPSEIFHHDLYLGENMQLEELPDEAKENIRAVAGHYFYGIHEHIPNPSNYFTMLREPVERVISLYYYFQNIPGYENVKKMTLEEFATNSPEASNFQTLIVSGELVKPDLNKAIDNLKTFTVVGVTERFDETLFLLKNVYEWENIHYSKKNVTKNRPLKEDIPPQVIEIIRQKNALDIKLYNLAKQLCEEKIQALSLTEKKQLEEFKKNQR